MGRPDLALEHKIWRVFRQLRTRPCGRVLMAISGGVDSMVMATVLLKWKRPMGVDLAVAHVHHGGADDPVQRDYRDQTQQFVATWANQHGLPFFTNPVRDGIRLRSEADLRRWRQQWIRDWRRAQGFDAVALAHHRDDLVETRLSRLIRGSGSQGLKAMDAWSKGVWRPLLTVGRRDLIDYARARQLKWQQDPSNADVDGGLRNWLRHEWLPALERRHTGGVENLARSLERLVPSGPSVATGPHVGLRREVLARSSTDVQRTLVARYLRGLGVKGYTQHHVDELLKRLAVRGHTEPFAMLGLRFHISPDFLWASRV